MRDNYEVVPVVAEARVCDVQRIIRFPGGCVGVEIPGVPERLRCVCEGGEGAWSGGGRGGVGALEVVVRCLSDTSARWRGLTGTCKGSVTSTCKGCLTSAEKIKNSPMFDTC